MRGYQASLGNFRVKDFYGNVVNKVPVYINVNNKGVKSYFYKNKSIAVYKKTLKKYKDQIIYFEIKNKSVKWSSDTINYKVRD